MLPRIIFKQRANSYCLIISNIQIINQNEKGLKNLRQLDFDMIVFFNKGTELVDKGNALDLIYLDLTK